MMFREYFKPSILEKRTKLELEELKNSVNELKLNYNASTLTDVSKKEINEKNEIITIKQQILILEYLGAFQKINRIDNGTKKADFLALLLNKNKQNIREVLGKYYELKSSKISNNSSFS